MSIQLRQLNSSPSYSLHGLTMEDVTLLSLALKVGRKEVAKELDQIKNVTIKAMMEQESSHEEKLAKQEHISERLMDISQALNSAPIKTRSDVHTD